MIISRLCAGALFALLAGCNSSSDTSDLMDDPPIAGGTSPIISVDNYEPMLREIITIANDGALNAASDSLDPLFGSVGPVADLIDQAIIDGASSGNGLTFVSSAAISEGGEQSEYTFSCDSGGTLVARAYKDDMVGGPFVDRLVAEGACSIDDAAYEGSAYKGVRFVRGTDVSTFENFSVSQADGDSLLIDGEYSDSSPEQRGPRVVTGWTDAKLLAVEDGETTKVDGYTSNRTSLVQSGIPDSGTTGATADVTFTVTAPWTSGEPLDVVVELSYVDPEDSIANEFGAYPAQWQSGTLRVVAADGTGLTLSPDTGDSATFSVTIDGETGGPITLAWVDGFQITCASGFDCR